MRYFRLCIIGALSLIGSIFLLHMPSYAFTAVPAELGSNVLEHMEASLDAAKTLMAVVVEPADLAFAAQIHNAGGHLIYAAAATPLKPEYAESYQTHGLIFLKPPLRC